MAAAVDEAERRAGRDLDRRARVARLVTLLSDIPAALRQRPYTATAQGVRTALSELLCDVVQPGASSPPGPHCDDWRALARPFTAQGIDRGFVKPRLLCDYRESPRAAPAPHGHHTRANPAGVYALHLISCGRCRTAEAIGVPDAACEIHTLAASHIDFYRQFPYLPACPFDR